MGSLTYLAVDQGRMISGHSEGTEYSFDLNFRVFTPNTKRAAFESKPLSKKYKTTTFLGKEYLANVATVWIDSASVHAQMNEFLDSIDAGEEFILDPYGTALSPVEQYTCKIVGDPSQTRYRHMERWKYAFKISYSPSDTVII